MNKKICIIDGSGFIFRAFHALPPMYSKNNIPVNAVYGFTKSLMSIVQSKSFDYLVVVFDNAKKTFRNDLYNQYKSHRPPLPEELIPQFSLIREATKALNVKSVELEGFEADDLIATYVQIAKDQDLEVQIMSSDKDLMQLVDDEKKIYMFDSIKKKKITYAQVVEKFGVSPDNVVYVQAILGDSSDNIPGVKGIGIKGASTLVAQYGSLDNIYKNIDNIQSKSIVNKLIEHRETAYLSLKLVTLVKDIKIDTPIEDFKIQDVKPNELLEFLQRVSFSSMAEKVASSYGINLNDGNNLEENALNKYHINTSVKNITLTKNVETITLDEFVNHIQKISQSSLVAIHIDENNQMFNILDNKTNMNYAIEYTDGLDLIYNNQKPTLDNVFKEIQILFENPSISFVGYNIKFILKHLNKLNIRVSSYEDIMLMEYLFNGSITSDTLQNILHANNIFPSTNITAYEIFSLYMIYKNHLISNKCKYLYESIDKPLLEILTSMENCGIAVNGSFLKQLSDEYEQKIKLIESKVYEISQCEFNLASPKQIGEIFFEKLKFPGKKNKSGSWKTDVDTLEELSLHYPIANLLIEHRQLSKLKNTYTDKLPTNISPITNRIHTTYLQCSTLTGRLSSIDPNLQNIPIKTPEGRSIRKAFVAKDGYKILSLDYSQIELRVLAVVANVTNLIESFNKNLDIHSQTASEIFQVDLNQVNTDLRRKAKAINFGIIYGQSIFGLAKTLNITKESAKEYIEKYFQNYPQIKQYMDNTINFAKENGFVLTCFKRKCFIHDINSSNFNIRSLAQRSAINAIIQGTASDIMRLALRDVYYYIKEHNIDCNILLQIHDEMLIEIKEDMAEKYGNIFKTIMENVLRNNPFSLNIPLVVNYSFANNWLDAH